MESVGILETIAEVSIGMAGFGGIAAGLGYRARGKWSAEDRARLIVMVGVSLIIVFACLVPFVLYFSGVEQHWKIAAMILFPFQATVLAFQIWINRAGIPKGYHPLVAILSFIVQLAAMWFLLKVIFYESNPENYFGQYLSVVVLLLVLASILFLRLLVTSFRDSDAAS